MKKYWFFCFILSCLIILTISGCIKSNNTADIDDSSSLPDNKITSIVKDFAKKIWANYSDIKEEEFEWYNYAQENNNDYTINWYSVEKSGVLPKDSPSTVEFFDWWHVEYIWDEIWWSLIEFKKDDIICYYNLFYDQQVPYELMAWEWDYDSDEYNKARDEFSENLTYTLWLSCWLLPKSAPQFENLYFNADGQEPFWSASIRWNTIIRFDPEKTEYYYLSSIKQDGDNIHLSWYNIEWDIKKEDCIDDGKWDTHDYKITISREWDMMYMWCADKIDPDFLIWEEWTLWNFIKKTNYQYKWKQKRSNVSYSIIDMVNKYMQVSLYEINEDVYESYQLIMEKTENGWKVLYEWDYDVDDDKCEELNQYDNNLMEIFFLRDCPRW